jgi:hypothetical protein
VLGDLLEVAAGETLEQDGAIAVADAQGAAAIIV